MSSEPPKSGRFGGPGPARTYNRSHLKIVMKDPHVRLLYLEEILGIRTGRRSQPGRIDPVKSLVEGDRFFEFLEHCGWMDPSANETFSVFALHLLQEFDGKYQFFKKEKNFVDRRIVQIVESQESFKEFYELPLTTIFQKINMVLGRPPWSSIFLKQGFHLHNSDMKTYTWFEFKKMAEHNHGVVGHSCRLPTAREVLEALWEVQDKAPGHEHDPPPATINPQECFTRGFAELENKEIWIPVFKNEKLNPENRDWMQVGTGDFSLGKLHKKHCSGKYPEWGDNSISDAKKKYYAVMDGFSIEEQLPERKLYHSSNNGKIFLSIDIRSANFTVLQLFNSDMVLGCNTWDELMHDPEILPIRKRRKLIINSKMLRVSSLGKLAHDKGKRIQAHILDQIYQLVLEETETENQKNSEFPHSKKWPKNIFRSSLDEMFFETTERKWETLKRNLEKLLKEKMPKISENIKYSVFKLLGFEKISVLEFQKSDILSYSQELQKISKKPVLREIGPGGFPTLSLNELKHLPVWQTGEEEADDETNENTCSLVSVSIPSLSIGKVLRTSVQFRPPPPAIDDSSQLKEEEEESFTYNWINCDADEGRAMHGEFRDSCFLKFYLDKEKLELKKVPVQERFSITKDIVNSPIVIELKAKAHMRFRKQREREHDDSLSHIKKPLDIFDASQFPQLCKKTKSGNKSVCAAQDVVDSCVQEFSEVTPGFETLCPSEILPLPFATVVAQKEKIEKLCSLFPDSDKIFLSEVLQSFEWSLTEAVKFLQPAASDVSSLDEFAASLQEEEFQDSPNAWAAAPLRSDLISQHNLEELERLFALPPNIIASAFHTNGRDFKNTFDALITEHPDSLAKDAKMPQKRSDSVPFSVFSLPALANEIGRPNKKLGQQQPQPSESENIKLPHSPKNSQKIQKIEKFKEDYLSSENESENNEWKEVEKKPPPPKKKKGKGKMGIPTKNVFDVFDGLEESEENLRKNRKKSKKKEKDFCDEEEEERQLLEAIRQSEIEASSAAQAQNVSGEDEEDKQLLEAICESEALSKSVKENENESEDLQQLLEMIRQSEIEAAQAKRLQQDEEERMLQEALQLSQQTDEISERKRAEENDLELQKILALSKQDLAPSPLPISSQPEIQISAISENSISSAEPEVENSKPQPGLSTGNDFNQKVDCQNRQEEPSDFENIPPITENLKNENENENQEHHVENLPETETELENPKPEIQPQESDAQAEPRLAESPPPPPVVLFLSPPTTSHTNESEQFESKSFAAENFGSPYPGHATLFEKKNEKYCVKSEPESSVIEKENEKVVEAEVEQLGDEFERELKKALEASLQELNPFSKAPSMSSSQQIKFSTMESKIPKNESFDAKNKPNFVEKQKEKISGVGIFDSGSENENTEIEKNENVEKEEDELDEETKIAIALSLSQTPPTASSNFKPFEFKPPPAPAASQKAAEGSGSGQMEKSKKKLSQKKRKKTKPKKEGATHPTKKSPKTNVVKSDSEESAGYATEEDENYKQAIALSLQESQEHTFSSPSFGGGSSSGSSFTFSKESSKDNLGQKQPELLGERNDNLLSENGISKAPKNVNVLPEGFSPEDFIDDIEQEELLKAIALSTQEQEEERLSSVASEKAPAMPSQVASEKAPAAMPEKQKQAQGPEDLMEAILISVQEFQKTKMKSDEEFERELLIAIEASKMQRESSSGGGSGSGSGSHEANQFFGSGFSPIVFTAGSSGSGGGSGQVPNQERADFAQEALKDHKDSQPSESPALEQQRSPSPTPSVMSTTSSLNNKFCSFCGLSGGKFKVCSECKAAKMLHVPRYCSSECQKKAWKSHKSECARTVLKK